MFPRSLRLALLVLCLLAVVVFSVPFKSSSAAGDKGKSSSRGRFAQGSQTLNQNSRTQGPPNYDAFGASQKKADASFSQDAQQQQQSGHLVQSEPRLGVPTFLWASETGKGATKQISSDLTQAKVDIESAARGYLGDYGSNYRLSDTDVAAARLVAVHDTGKGAIIAKFKQDIAGVEVFRDEINVIMNRQLQLIALSGYLTGDGAGSNVTGQDFTLQPAEALSKAVTDLTGATVDPTVFQNTSQQSSLSKEDAFTTQDQNPYLIFTPNQSGGQGFLFGEETLRVKKVFYHLVDGYVPAYYVEANVLVPSNDSTILSATGEIPRMELAYSYVISAADGQVLFRNNLVDDQKAKGGDKGGDNLAPGGFTYKVWADPATGVPYDTPAGNAVHPKVTASPDGVQYPFLLQNNVQIPNYPFSQNDPWLAPGSTTTTGNNVEAFVNLVNAAGNNDNGFGPAAEPPADPPTGDHHAFTSAVDSFLYTTQPDVDAYSVNARQASITQLFYDINFLHDWYYDAGFNEAAGNAQTNNFGRGGLGNDSIKGQAQDTQSFSNANMLTPADGSRPRMRMYNFPNPANMLDIQAPAGIAGKVNIGISQTGTHDFYVTNDIVIATFSNSPSACTVTNAAALNGKIAMFDFDNTDGTGCSFSTRITRIHATGAAVALMVYTSGSPTSVANITGLVATHTKGVGVISWNNGQAIKGQLAVPNTVTARLLRVADRDGALDAQIVSHEWGHYISNRLIGNGNGLNANYAGGLGEGWGDFNAMLAVTVREDDTSTPSNANWNGAYALATYATGGIPFNGSQNQAYYYGIRRYPYSTDMAINPLTFKHIQNGIALPVGPPVSFGANGANNSEVHNTGEVWAEMLWECYASLLRDTLGASPRLTFQEAQDRMKNYMVAAYKGTPFTPTLLEARDAVLAAAYAYDYNDGRLFAQAFAKRGAGVGAISPDRFSATNSTVTESYDAGSSIAYVSASLDDSTSSCDYDNYLDNGETGLLKVSIKNTGFQNLFGTTATVTSSNAHVTFPNGATITFPASEPGQTVTGSVAVATTGMSSGIKEGSDFTITIQDSGPPATSPVVAHFYENVNIDEIPASTATDTVEAKQTVWTTNGTNIVSNPNVSTKWSILAPTALPTDRVWFAPDAYFASDQYLTSPVFTVDGSGSANLQFDHSFGFEFDGNGNYDGGVVEMSVNGGAFTDMGIGGGLPNYNGTILNYSGDLNPLKGRPGFVQNGGTPSVPVHTSFTKAIAPGSTLQVRFRLGSDSSAGSSGWRVNNIALTGVVETPFTTLAAETTVCNPPPPPPPVTVVLSPATAPAGAIGTPYNLTLTPSGGTGPYSYTITPVVLPPGLASAIDPQSNNLVISGTPTQAGTYLIAVKATDSASHQSTTNYTIVINKGTPVITWSDPADITFPTTLSATQLNATANVPGTFSYDPLATTGLNAGANQALMVTFDPTDTTNYQSTSKTVHINVLKATPTITWNNPVDITYGTALSATQLNATASTPGAFVYTPSATTVLSAGANQNLQVDFTPTDTTNFNTASKTVQINVLKATPTITWSDPADITYGTALSAIQLNATADVLGTFTYTPGSDTGLNAGASQQLKVDFVPTDTTNYQSTSKTVHINVLKATPTITWNNPVDITYGTALSATQLNATASTPGAFVYTPPATTVLDVGNNQNLSVVFTPNDTTNYSNASKNVAINVLKATPTITWSNPADITYGTALSATQLNATVSGVPGTITFNPAAGTILNAGSNQILFASFTPTDTTRYTNATKNVSINVLKANQNITFSPLSGKIFGDAPFNVSATTSSGLPVVFSIFSGPASISGNTVTITGVGPVVVRATVAPNSNYNDATPVDQSFAVAKANQTITFGALPSKTFGDAPFNLSATSTSGLPVSFNRVSGPVTVAGNTVTITGVGHVVLRALQAGDGSYNAAPNVDQAFDVTSANANIALSNLSFIYDGTAKTATVTTNPNGLTFSLTYSQNNIPVTAPTNAGSYNVTATITDPNYQGTTTGTLVINKVTPVITWANPANITFPTPLSATQLNATANVPGTFQYSLPLGAVLSVGSYQLSTTFTPTDTANYNNAAKSVSLTVDPTPLPTLGFANAAFTVNENGGNVAIAVNRGGDTSVPVTVNYATSDTAGLNPCSLVNGIASSRCDYAITIGTLRFAAAETSKTIFIPIVDDSYSEGPENFTLTLSNPGGATLGSIATTTVTITDNDAINGANPISFVAFFVRQQYIDFLGREPDPIGYQGWQNILNNCPASGKDANGNFCDRIEVSADFFRSPEFQDRGYFIYRFYSAGLGRIPLYSEFETDLAKVSGFLDPQQLEANKVAFVNEFMSRQGFLNKYGALNTPTAYVDALLQTAGLPNHPARAAWIAGLTNSTMTRAQVLRALIESTEVYNRFYNEAFVVMQYFGFLRRDPDVLYLQWVQLMNTNGGDYRAMISGFLNSNEYVLRFGK